MPKTRAEKIEDKKRAEEELKKSQSLVIADFTGLSVNTLNVLRKSLKEAHMKFQVAKKRLLKLIFEEKGIGLNPKELSGQTGVVFSEKDIVGTAQAVYKFQKANKESFKMLAGVSLTENKIYSQEEIEAIGKLPSREVLLGQLAAMLTYPLRSFLYTLDQRAKVSNR